MCLRCLFSAPLQLTYTPSTGYRIWIPHMPAAGTGATIDEAFEAFADELVLFTDWLDERHPHGYGSGEPPVDPRVLWRVLRPRLRRQILEPVGACQDPPHSPDFS